jgi:apolipoprotein D and lipocalin family protein
MEEKAVKEIDIKRFMGNWYEVARLCNLSKKNSLVAVTLEASMDPKGIIHLFLTGHKLTPYGPVKQLRGKGKWNENRPGTVRNTFFLNFYRDYYILHANEDYSTTIISNQTGTRLHILSRHPSLSSEEVSSIRDKVHSLGYDTEVLCWSETYF